MSELYVGIQGSYGRKESNKLANSIVQTVAGYISDSRFIAANSSVTLFLSVLVCYYY